MDIAPGPLSNAFFIPRGGRHEINEVTHSHMFAKCRM